MPLYTQSIIKGAAYGAAIADRYVGERDKFYKWYTGINGHPKGTATSKRAVINTGGTSADQNTRTLYTQQLVLLSKTDQTSEDHINERERQMAYVSGCKICMQFVNKGTSILYVNVAVVYKRYDGSAPTETDFFRGSNIERGSDFGITLSSLELNCLPINADEYVVLWRKRMKLPAAGAESQGRHVRQVHKWVPIKKQFRFKDNSATPIGGSPYLIYWFDRHSNQANSAVNASECNVFKRWVVYFREPKNK